MVYNRGSERETTGNHERKETMKSFTLRDVESGKETIIDVCQNDHGTYNAVCRDDAYGDGMLDERCETVEELIDDVIEEYSQAGRPVELVN